MIVANHRVRVRTILKGSVGSFALVGLLLMLAVPIIITRGILIKEERMKRKAKEIIAKVATELLNLSFFLIMLCGMIWSMRADQDDDS